MKFKVGDIVKYVGLVKRYRGKVGKIKVGKTNDSGIQMEYYVEFYTGGCHWTFAPFLEPTKKEFLIYRRKERG
jgi:hypothetical protein